MKKKIYFIIASIIQILLQIYTIATSNIIIQETLKQISIYPVEMQEQMTNMLTKNGVIFINVLAIISMIFSLIILYFAVKDKMSKHKKAIIILSILSIFFAEYSISLIISLINIIVASSIKTVKENKEKKEIPKLERIDNNKKDIICGIILVAIYFSQLIWGGWIPESFTIAMMIQIIFDLIMLILSITFFWKKLKRDIGEFKNNAKTYISYVLPKLGIMYIIYFLVSFMVSGLLGESINQQAIKALPLWYTIPGAIIWAPIVEEIIFRGCIRRFIRSDKLYIITSAIIFGLIHTISEANILNMIIISLPYAILGGFLAYIYDKTDNLSNNILCHGFQNLIAMTIIVIGT